jgi:shikimate kinase
MKIFLIGMPGSGKSTIGKGLAQKLQLPFMDLDEQIVKYTGKPIKEIFEQEGEESFRITETRLLEAITVGNTRFVMATGGGAPCFYDNLTFMKDSGLTVFLDVTTGELAKRLLDTKISERPLLKNVNEHNALQELEEKLFTRIPYYTQAHIKVKSDQINEDMVALKLNEYFNRN